MDLTRYLVDSYGNVQISLALPFAIFSIDQLVMVYFQMTGNQLELPHSLKQGDRDDLNNYRPISVISVVAKVFERIIYDQVYGYLEEHNIICKHQSDFRAAHSTVTALLEITDTWAYNIERGKINAIVFLDLKKAFDSVDHKILLSNLKTTEYRVMHINGLNHI